MSVIIANYEVIRFIEHGSRCRPMMDYVQGELLIYRVGRCPEIEKKVLFTWFRQLLIQIDQYHRCRRNQSYRYINPYSVLITKDDQIMLLDLDAESNAFVLKNMQKRAMRNHFIKPIVHIKENTKISLDLYGYAKTVQFILSEMKVEPHLTRWEEHRLAKVIKKCLDEEPKKQYEELKQVEKELPIFRAGETGSVRRKYLMGLILLAGILILAVTYKISDKRERQTIEQEQKTQENSVEVVRAETQGTEEQDAETEGPEDGLEVLEKEVKGMEQHLLRNTGKGNQDAILEGEKIHREVVRYLAAAYDREASKERALEAYQELCALEEQEDYLEAAYIRRMELETELFYQERIAVETGEEAMKRFLISEELANIYAETVCVCEELSEEEKEKILQPLSEQFPEIRKSEHYMKWEAKQQEKFSEENITEEVVMEENSP